MKVVKKMTENHNENNNLQNNEPLTEAEVKDETAEQATEQKEGNGSRWVRIKPFHFVMLLFFVVFLTAGITTFALAFGDEKVVEVGVPTRTEFNKLFEAYDILKKEYYDELDQEALVDGAINGMMEALGDPYSDYMNQAEAESFHMGISSSFQGIGAEIQEKDGYIMVVSPIKGSPAEKAGLKPQDIILAVDGESISGYSATEAVNLIRGEKGTDVILTIQRPGAEETMDITITRDEIPIQTVYGEMINDSIGKVQITSFSQNTTDELRETIQELEEQGMEGLVLDIRQNPGGLLTQAVSISSLFVPKDEILFQVETKDGKVEQFVSAEENPIDIPVVVVIDEGSASASEILAAAVSESAGIPLVGKTTFGKGTVQTAYDFDDKSNIKLTSAKWLTPSGEWIHEKGVKPDYEVSLPEFAFLPYINPETELKESIQSKEVETAEKMLEVIGYNPGKVDGLFDENTKNAVLALQKAAKLEETGILSSDTTVELMNRFSASIQENDTQIQKAVEVITANMAKQ
ncbi:carboxyl-terminal processing protease [Bacillus oleivorans]|uniref:Carboxyl-terminal processing protease n=2 Tax=Bacillus oleivorans TaxID=1448271 RepID=A0A285CLB1_9BACI|nr:carboxyl-terminal processing protease [Bacillus oleivorans]